MFLTWTHVSDRYSNDENTRTLPGYDKFDAGVSFDVGNRWNFQLSGDNLTDEIGLTEGNPRTDVGAGASGAIYVARPLFGRSFMGSVTYRILRRRAHDPAVAVSDDVRQSSSARRNSMSEAGSVASNTPVTLRARDRYVDDTDLPRTVARELRRGVCDRSFLEDQPAPRPRGHSFGVRQRKRVRLGARVRRSAVRRRPA